MVKAKENLVGAYAFLAGVILAIVLGLSQKYVGSALKGNWPYAVLMVLGIIIGFLNVADKDSKTFLLASLALVIVSAMGQSALIYVSTIPILSSLNAILAALLVLFVPATIIVALKTVFSIASLN
jgi:hypothetical protein